MACFAVPVAEAVAVTVIAQVLSHKEKKKIALDSSSSNVAFSDCSIKKSDGKINFSRKLMWLSKLLWGGSLLLAFEHIWHGEIVPWFPFLTAAGNAQDMAEVLHEMATVGVLMSVVVTAIWVGMVIVSDVIVKRPSKISEIEDLT